MIAGLAAQGETIVKGVQHIDRGYEDLEASFNSLGASVTRIPAEEWEAATQWSS